MRPVLNFLKKLQCLCIGLLVFAAFPLLVSAQLNKSYKTKYVIVVIMDGPRYGETWGDSSHQYIPFMSRKMASEGTVFTSFHNDGYTYTTSGHAAICTGFRQELENSKGTQLPAYPSFFQYYLKKHPEDSSKVWVVTTKDKLAILANCEDPDWKNKYNPKINCGVAGIGTGYRNDTTTFRIALDKLTKNQANIMLVNFKEPDHSGHAAHWKNYLKGIKSSDSLIYMLWKEVQSNPYYKDQTAFFVTNDHGRHSKGWKDGFISHGDSCESCRHINLFAAGPDFKKNTISAQYYTQVDLTATIANLLGLDMPFCQGKVIEDCFANQPNHIK